jgi:hypothetical protein
MSKYREMLSVLQRVCPNVFVLIKNWESKTLQEYCSSLWHQPCTGPTSWQACGVEHVRRALQKTLIQSYPDWPIESVLSTWDQLPLLQTADHLQLILDPSTASNNVAFAIGAESVGAKYAFVNASSTITMETRNRFGPGWLYLRGKPINVFGFPRKKLKRSSVCAARWRRPIQLEPHCSAQMSVSELGFLSQVRNWLSHLPIETPANALVSANSLIWEKMRSSKMPRIVWTDDRLIAEIVALHIEDDKSPLMRMLFQPSTCEYVLATLKASATRLPKACTLATDLFWLLRGDRIRPLRLQAGVLVEQSRTSCVRIPFCRAAVLDNLRKWVLFPDLFLSFAALTYFGNCYVAGGTSQLLYLSLFIETLRQTVGSGLSPNDVRQDPHRYNLWIAGVADGYEFYTDTDKIFAAAYFFQRRVDEVRHLPLKTTLGSLSLMQYLSKFDDFTI